MRVSVVVPALNEEAHLGGLLSDLAAQTRPGDEVFVVDAGSRDGTAEIASRFPFVTLLEGRPPVAKGRNLGGFSASGEVLVFLDADVRLKEGFLEGLVGEFEGRGLAVACPRYVPRTAPRHRYAPCTRSLTRCSSRASTLSPRGRGTASSCGAASSRRAGASTPSSSSTT
ncbi:glycosyltransferase [Rubrobacter marinus]|uniref:4,4'-diaponeurosporenoate glycosyltransferase n=1 Tax=Rubrobacter marinus TaxID=2653852 RepID=A0A6G8PUT8_9ACTN|nr:glycosyltransferase [Rubrobacter marinus]QIN77921.1 glycosyltransferase [Rubrobacter marinus]